DHVGEIALVHFGHAAAGMACREITAEQLVLLLGRPRLAGGDFEIAVPAKQFALAGGRLEFGGHDPNRHAGRAIDAARTVGDRLAAAETDAAERVVELTGVAAGQLGEDFALNLAGQIGARRRIGHEELRKAEWCAQPDSPSQWLLNTLCDW